MKTLIAWFLEKTKAGQTVKKVQEAVDGKKQMIASLAAALTATITIIMKFGEQGMPYLMGLASTIEFATASAGWIGFFNALKGEKIRAENAEIIAGQQPTQPPQA